MYRDPRPKNRRRGELARRALGLITLALLLPAASAAQEPALIPQPRSLERTGAPALEIARAPVVAVGDEALRPLAEAFAATWWRLTGDRPTVSTGAAGDFVLALDAAELEPERYRLAVGEQARITGGSLVGAAHGTASVLQLASRSDAGWTLPGVAIDDAPDAPFRAVMVDVARQPHRVETLRDVVDLLYLYKVRYLHLHLTDDQAFCFPFPPVTDALPENRTIPLESWRELVAYADARGVTIVPELDLPGHSTQLKRSGYLDDPTPDDPLSDADVAHPVNHERIFAIIDALRAVFASSPYFHVGGDESGAGRALVPFLAAVNEHLRSDPGPGGRTRLLVWEGFGGRPAVLPATGADRVVVLSWESAYNPPWNLLDAGYEVVNASWKPLYVVGGGSYRYPHIGGRKWPARDIHDWGRTEFWHWQPGTPVFEDRGPGDERLDDGVWHAPPERHAQVLGGGLLFWEQREHTVLRDAWDRVAALADRLWSEDASDFVGFRRRHDAVGERVRRLVQPVRMTLAGDVDLAHPTADDFVWFDRAVTVALDVPQGPAGVVRVTRDGCAPTSASPACAAPIEVTEDAQLTARLFVDGEPVGAETRAAFSRRPARVRCAWFELPRRALSEVPDFSDRRRWSPARVDLLPELRGPYRMVRPLGQQLDATLVVSPEQAGPHTFRLQTRDGRARLLLDGAPLLGPSEPSEVKLEATVELAAGPHALRVFHASGHISPVLIVAVRRPDDERFTEISPLLAEVPRGTEPEALSALESSVDLLADGLGGWQLMTSDDAVALADVARLDEDGVLRISGSPSGYLQTRRWYRDYELELEWRWPEGSRGGNSGVLVHVTTPLLFYGWPRSLEVQLQAGRAGDFWTIGEGVDLTVEDAAERRRAPRPGDLHSHRRIARRVDGLEREPGSWNHLRVRCDGGEVVVHVNGVETNRGVDCTISAGALALQSEGAPIELRDVRLQPLRRSPR